MNFLFLLIGLLLVIVLFQIFRSSEILGVATKKVSKSFEYNSGSNKRFLNITGNKSIHNNYIIIVNKLWR